MIEVVIKWYDMWYWLLIIFEIYFDCRIVINVVLKVMWDVEDVMEEEGYSFNILIV